MSEFAYKAINQSGRISRGRMVASNSMELEQRIQNQEQDLISFNEVTPKKFRLGANKLQRRDLINMLFQLEQLTKSGVPLLEGLRDLRDSASPSYYRDVLASLIESIEGGKTFSQSLEDFPKDFDSIFIALISVGEETGELPEILNDMAETLRWIDELVASTVKIITYPAIVCLVVLSVTVFLMVYLVPQIIPFVKEMGGEVPGHTLALIAVSEFFTHYWWVLLASPIIITLSIKYLSKRNKKIHFKIDNMKLKIPLFGPISYKIKIARLTNYMALLYASGITVLRSIEICKTLMGNIVLEKALTEIASDISRGIGISDSFSRTELFPPLVIRMLRVGENTGNLDKSLLNVSYFFNREIQETIDKIEPAITPILTVVMGVLLGWIMMSVLGPVWDAVGSING